MAEAEPCCKRLHFGISFFDNESDDDFYHSEPPIITVSQSTDQLPLMDDYEDEEYTNPFDSLPNEMIQQIFMMLSLIDRMSLRLVNRRLYMICSDPYLWRNVVIDHKYHPPFIKSATVHDAGQWLCNNSFTSHALSTFANFDGIDLLLLSRNNLIEFCGFADGVRLYNALHISYRSVAAVIVKTIYISLEEGTVYDVIFLETLTAKDLRGCIARRLSIAPSVITSIMLQRHSGNFVNMDDSVIRNMNNEQFFVITKDESAADGSVKVIMKHV